MSIGIVKMVLILNKGNKNSALFFEPGVQNIYKLFFRLGGLSDVLIAIQQNTKSLIYHSRCVIRASNSCYPCSSIFISLPDNKFIILILLNDGKLFIHDCFKVNVLFSVRRKKA